MPLIADPATTFAAFWIIATLAGMVLLYWHPDAGLAVFWFVVTQKTTVFDAVPNIRGFLLPSYIMMFLPLLLSRRRRSIVIVPHSLVSAYIGLMMISVASLTFSTEQVGFLQFQRLWAYSLLAISFFILRLTDHHRFGLFAAAQLVSGLLLAAWVIAGSYMSDQAYRAGLSSNPNDVTVVLGFGVLASSRLWIPWHGRGLGLLPPIVGFTTCVLQLYAIVLLASRGITLAVICGLIGYVSTRAKNPMRVASGALLLILLFTMIFYLPGGDSFVKRFQEHDTDTLNLRIPIWEAGWRAFAQSPFWRMLLGHGVDASDGVTNEAVMGQGSMHNSLLQLLFDQGIAGALLFLWLQVRCIVPLWRTRVIVGSAIAMGLLTFLIVCGLSSSVDHMFIYWIGLGSVWAAAYSPYNRKVELYGRQRKHPNQYSGFAVIPS